MVPIVGAQAAGLSDWRSDHMKRRGANAIVQPRQRHMTFCPATASQFNVAFLTRIRLRTTTSLVTAVTVSATRSKTEKDLRASRPLVRFRSVRFA